MDPRLVHAGMTVFRSRGDDDPSHAGMTINLRNDYARIPGIPILGPDAILSMMQ
jgi:hypothetical protein